MRVVLRQVALLIPIKSNAAVVFQVARNGVEAADPLKMALTIPALQYDSERSLLEGQILRVTPTRCM
eukprot:4339297-Pyramimonas_sp.AAC.1